MAVASTARFSTAPEAEKLSLHGALRILPSDSGTPREPQHACRISVIVPTRNRPALLGRMLERIRSQRFTAFEVIVVDDGSSAATRAAYAGLWQGLDERFKRIELGCPDSPGLGPSLARNTGIDAAAGGILTFCDDDDFWTSDGHLAAMAEVFDADPGIDLYIANQSAVACDGRVERRDWLPGLVARVQGRARTHARGYRLELADLIHGGGFAQLNILAVSKATAQAIGGFWTRTSYEEDRDFFWRAADAARHFDQVFQWPYRRQGLIPKINMILLKYLRLLANHQNINKSKNILLEITVAIKILIYAPFISFIARLLPVLLPVTLSNAHRTLLPP